MLQVSGANALYLLYPNAQVRTLSSELKPGEELAAGATRHGIL